MSDQRRKFPTAKPPARKARVQMTLTTKNKLDRTRAQKEGGTFNVWFGRAMDSGPRHLGNDQIPFTRCNPETDSGITRGSETRPDTTFCIHFARGCCAKGYDCNFLHRVPQESDEAFIHRGIDCFGRERHRDDRDDMDGVGSFDRNNTTLYVARVGTYDDPEEVLERHFGAFGATRSVKVLHTRNIAFVRYKSRLNAEFAKEAMRDQSLDTNECLVVRWAIEDPNPRAKVEEIEELEATFVQKVLADPARHGQLLYETQTEHELNRYYTNDDTSAQAAPWLYTASDAVPAGMIPPPPPPRKKKKRTVDEALKQVQAGRVEKPKADAVKKSAVALVAGYESD